MVNRKRRAAEAAVAAGAVARPRGAAPKGFPDWDGQRGVWTSSDGGVKEPGGRAASSAGESSSAASQPPEPQEPTWEEQHAASCRSIDLRHAQAARTPLKSMIGPIMLFTVDQRRWSF